jgi:hypothetical protein
MFVVGCTFLIAGFLTGIGALASTIIEGFQVWTLFQGQFVTSGLDDPVDDYQVGQATCHADLMPVDVTEVLGTAGNYFNVLSASYPTSDGWTYSSGPDLSDGALTVRTYDVLGTATKIGAEMHIQYQPGGSDPQTDVHWIQIVTDNHNITQAPGHGNNENVVDTDSVNGQSPYYDDGFAAESGSCVPWCNFYDFPGRVDADRNHDWKAVTFLVQGPEIGMGPGNITFFGPGFEWGWTNACTQVDDDDGGYRSSSNGTVLVQADGPIIPNADLNATVILPASMTLTKHGVSATVFLNSATIRFKVDPKKSAGGISDFKVLSGSGQFDPYIFGRDSVGSSSFNVLDGEGSILWATGEISARVRLSVSAPFFTSFLVTAYGRGTINPVNNRITVDPVSRGIEIASSAQSLVKTPALSIALMWALTLALLLAGIILLNRHRVALDRGI